MLLSIKTILHFPNANIHYSAYEMFYKIKITENRQVSSFLNLTKTNRISPTLNPTI